MDLIERIPPWFWITLVVHVVVLGTVAYLILLERKVASWVQDRIGPNRVGLGFGIIPFLKDFHFWGLGQPLADGLKFIFKEDYRPGGVDKVLFTLAPIIMIVVVIVSIAVIPWGGVHRAIATYDVTGAADPRAAAVERIPGVATEVGETEIHTVGPEFVAGVPVGPERTLATVTYLYPFQIADLDIGVLFILALLSLAVYGVVIGGYASNNKYSFLGGLRATANMISYEIPLGLAVITIVLMFGSLNLGYIVEKQAHYWAGWIPAWNVFAHPLAFLMFLICIHAEANRAPFDMAEAEQELVGGYHTEYSSMRFALFFLAEYAGMITTSAVCVALFFGGWHIPWLDLVWPHVLGDPATNPAVVDSLWVCILRAAVFFAKTLLVLFVFMWVRWSLPRFRFDQLMMLAWRALIPIALAILFATAVVVYLYAGPEARPQMRVGGWMALTLLCTNVVLGVLMLLISRLLPPAPETNRRRPIPGSRFTHTPLPAGT